MKFLRHACLSAEILKDNTKAESVSSVQGVIQRAIRGAVDWDGMRTRPSFNRAISK